ncbi:polysaccharide deacetylase [Erysipelothrix amsterdamensis]|uniref:Polysaccharide deacetylase n=1 Tax=Erysipelothrix amsterdamensis TaxID=2929157 RepID=A0AAU9VH22_9FIRM|nr:polysaccharide deacetylase [Erysipelothrix sp. A18Y020d]CAH2762078.1 polysaccharide deacetylase [Erysipelothrix sp. A18Y020d]
MLNRVGKKQTMILVVIITLISFVFCFSIYSWRSSLKVNEKKDVPMQELKLSVTEYELELGDAPPDFKQFIMKSDIKENVDIDLSQFNKDEIGEYEIKYRYTDLNIPYGNSLIVKIHDTMPPFMKLKNLVMEMGSTVDVMQFVEEYQDYQEVVFSFKDEPDMNRKGNQYIRILATDASGNSTYKTVMLTLNEKIESSPNHNAAGVVEPTTPNKEQPSSAPSSFESKQPPSFPNKNGSYVKFPIEQHGTFDDAFIACQRERAEQINSGVTGIGSCRPYKVNGINKGYELIWE